MELTREMIATIAKQYKREQDYYYAGMKIDNLTGLLAEALLAEMDKPNLWKDAPIDACHMRGFFENKDEKLVSTFAYHRSPPKTRIDEIAEEAKDLYMATSAGDRDGLTHIIKSAILKDREEREANR